jgi:hypothetical protein
MSGRAKVIDMREACNSARGEAGDVRTSDRGHLRGRENEKER